MPFIPHDLVPEMPGRKLPLASLPEGLRETVPDGEALGTVCSLRLWERVNRRRKVVGLPPLHSSQRSPIDLALAVLEMRKVWVKGEDWDEVQPGDDPLLTRVVANSGYPQPRSVYARISYEGAAIWSVLRVPKMNVASTDFSSGGPFYTPGHYPENKEVVLSTYSEDGPVFTIASGHGLAVDQEVDLYWRQKPGCILKIKVTATTATTVTLFGGEGDPLPDQGTKCIVMADESKTITLHTWKVDSHVTCEGVGRVLDRMKYTSIGRYAMVKHPEENFQFTRNEIDSLSFFYTSYLPTAATINQFADQQFWLDEIPEFGYFNLTDIPLTPALRWQEYTNLNAGKSLDVVVRNYEADPAHGGQMTDYTGVSQVHRVLFTHGLDWPGAIWGIPTPSVWGVSNIILYNDILWSPLEGTTLSAPIDDTQTTLPVVSADGMPYNQSITVQIGTEQIRVVDTDFTDPDSIEVVRGYNNTTASSHPSGAVVTLIQYPKDFPAVTAFDEYWDTADTNAGWGKSWMKDYANEAFNDITSATFDTVESVKSGGQVFEFNNSTTWQVPVAPPNGGPDKNDRRILVQCWGGGGGGSDATGGGGGAYTRKIVFAKPGDNVTVTIGAGGGPGQSGGATWFKSPSDILAVGGNSDGTGGASSACIGLYKYSGGNGNEKGGGGASASGGYGAVPGKDGDSATNAFGAINLGQGGSGGTGGPGQSPGGGGSTGQAGAKGKVIITIYYSLGYNTIAIPDWMPYLQGSGANVINPSQQIINNNDPPNQVRHLPYVQWNAVPWDMGVPFGSITAGFVKNGYVAITGSGSWYIGSEMFNGWDSVNGYGYTREMIAVGSARVSELTNFLSSDQLILEIVSGALEPIGNPIGGFLKSQLIVGWENSLTEYNIIGESPFLSMDILHDFKRRVASIGVSGNGIRQFTFNNPDYALFHAEIYVWRRRKGTNTKFRYGTDLLEESVKTYQVHDELGLGGGVTLNGPPHEEDHTVITYDDVIATADRETELLPTTTEIIKWTDTQAQEQLALIGNITSEIPDTYVTRFEDLQIGEVFKHSILVNDVYLPFIKYTFNDSEDQDHDGLPDGYREKVT